MVRQLSPQKIIIEKLKLYRNITQIIPRIKKYKKKKLCKNYIGSSTDNIMTIEKCSPLSHWGSFRRIMKVYPNRTQRQLKNPYKPLKFTVCRDFVYYSSSTVPGGLLVRSYITLFTPLTSFMIRLMTRWRTSKGISVASAVMKSMVSTARSTTA